MKFPKDEELFQAIPTGRRRQASWFVRTSDSAEGSAESVSTVFDRCYQEKAVEEYEQWCDKYLRDSEDSGF